MSLVSEGVLILEPLGLFVLLSLRVRVRVSVRTEGRGFSDFEPYNFGSDLAGVLRARRSKVCARVIRRREPLRRLETGLPKTRHWQVLLQGRRILRRIVEIGQDEWQREALLPEREGGLRGGLEGRRIPWLRQGLQRPTQPQPQHRLLIPVSRLFTTRGLLELLRRPLLQGHQARQGQSNADQRGLLRRGLCRGRRPRSRCLPLRLRRRSPWRVAQQQTLLNLLILHTISNHQLQ